VQAGRLELEWAWKYNLKEEVRFSGECAFLRKGVFWGKKCVLDEDVCCDGERVKEEKLDVTQRAMGQFVGVQVALGCYEQ